MLLHIGELLFGGGEFFFRRLFFDFLFANISDMLLTADK